MRNNVWIVHEKYEGYDEIHLYKNMDDAYAYVKNLTFELRAEGYEESEYSQKFTKEELRKHHASLLEYETHNLLAKIEIRRMKVE